MFIKNVLLKRTKGIAKNIQNLAKENQPPSKLYTCAIRPIVPAIIKKDITKKTSDKFFLLFVMK